MITRTTNVDLQLPFKTKIVLSSIAFGLLVVTLSCSKPSPKPVLEFAVVEAELRAFEAAHRAAIDSKNIDAILQYYTPDYVNVSSEEPIQYGREFIRPTMTKIYQAFDFHEDFRLIDTRIVGDQVVATYKWWSQTTPLTGGKTVVDSGKGLCLIKRSETGAWQFEMNAYTSDVVPPAAMK